MAMERILESDEERAAPIVPEERAKAAMRTRMSDLWKAWRISHRPDVLRPRLGPDIWWKFGFGRYIGRVRGRCSQQGLFDLATDYGGQRWHMWLGSEQNAR